MRAKQIEPLVREALTNKPATRDDDFLLMFEVYKHYIGSIEFHYLSIAYVLENHRDFGLPSFESITRARRKLQELDPALASSKKMQKIRDAEEAAYKAYAMEPREEQA